jgi:hypothetical protein
LLSTSRSNEIGAKARPSDFSRDADYLVDEPDKSVSTGGFDTSAPDEQIDKAVKEIEWPFTTSCSTGFSPLTSLSARVVL